MLRSVILKKDIIVPIGTSGVPVTPNPEIVVDIPFLLRKLTAYSAYDFAANIHIGGRPMSPRAIPRANLFGIGTNPFILTAPGYIPRRQSISIAAAPLTANADTLELVFIGLTGTEEELIRVSDNFKYFPFFYPGEIILTANQSDTLLINTETDKPFRGIKLMAESTGAFQVELSVDGTPWTRGRVRNTTIFGTAQLPLIVDPFDIPPGGIIRCDVTDLSGAGNTIKINIAGHKEER